MMLFLLLGAFLVWDAPQTGSDGSPLKDLAGYKVYIGESSRIYSTAVIDVGLIQSLELSWVLEYKKGYFITVTAYDTALNESAYGNEIFYILTSVSDIFQIYPNPFYDHVTILGNGLVKIFNLRGQRVKAVQVEKTAYVSTISLAPGSYFFRHKRKTIFGVKL